MSKQPKSKPQEPAAKPLVWIGSTRKDLSSFPQDVRRVMGFALRTAQMGGKHVDAKPLSGFRGAGVLEVVEDDDGSTYRAIYTVRFRGVVYALHAFKKKSKKGVKTPKKEIDVVRARLKEAADRYKKWKEENE